MKSVFEYFDYRKLLKDLFEDQKEQNRYFSYRVLGELVGFTSAGFFTKILQDTVNISSKNALAFAKAFRLTKIETRYFEVLVLFNQAKSHEERRYYFEQLLSMRKTKVQDLTSDQYDALGKWSYAVILEMLDYYPFKSDYRALASLVRPSIQPNEARHAIETLIAVGLIAKGSDGVYRPTGKTVTAEESVKSLAETNLKTSAASISSYAVQNVSEKESLVSSSILSVSRPTFETIREKMHVLRKEINDLVKKDKKADTVFQVNLHLFPVSRKYDRSLGKEIKTVRGRKKIEK